MKFFGKRNILTSAIQVGRFCGISQNHLGLVDLTSMIFSESVLYGP